VVTFNIFTGRLEHTYPDQATQVDVNAGIITNQFVSPATLKGRLGGLMFDTGILTYSGISVASTTQVNIGAVTGYIVDNETTPGTPTYTYINYSGELNKTVPTVGTGIGTYVLLNSSGTIVFQNTFPTSAQRKTHIYLSKIGHPAGLITTAGNEPDFITSPLAQFRDLFQAFNYVNQGVYPSANGSNLNINTSNGYVVGNGINYVIDKTTPNIYTVASQTPATFFRRTQTGAGGLPTNLIDPANMDVGGVITALGGGVNTSTLQYIYYVPPLGFIITYGQTSYTSLNDAVAQIGKESFTIYPNLIRNSILIGILAVKRSATTLNDPSQALFFRADMFGQVIGSVGGTSTGTMQTTYNNSLQPQISVTDTLGSVIYRNARALDTSNVFEVQNIAGTTTASINGNGQMSLGASTTTKSSLNIPSGTAPSSPINGDIWSDGSDIKVRLGGVTYTLSKI
jgi:hypothetical protein